MNYYVTVIRGNEYRLLYGPVKSHDIALSMVKIVQRKAIEIDPKTHFDYFGTIKTTDNKPGSLNEFVTYVT